MKQKIKKTVSVIVLNIFLFQNGIFAADVNAYKVSINSELGRVKQVFKGDPEKLIIHIQDAHANYEAQVNISNIIKTLLDEFSTKQQTLILGVEGAWDEYSFGSANLIPLEIEKNAVVNEYLKEGLLLGAEAATIKSSLPQVIHGLEDEQVFKNNFKAYRNISSKQAIIIEFLNNVESEMRRLKQKVFNPQLLSFDLECEKFYNNSFESDSFILKLFSLAKENSIDLFSYEYLYKLQEKAIFFSRFRRSDLINDIRRIAQEHGSMSEYVLSLLSQYNSEKITLKDTLNLINCKLAIKNIPVSDYATFSTCIKYLRSDEADSALQIRNELLSLSFQIALSLTTNKREQELLEGASIIRLLKSFFGLQATKKQVEQIARTEVIRELRALCNTFDMDLPDVIESVHNETINFYYLASLRDQILLNNLIQIMESNDSPIGILVAGGFHSKGIVTEMRRQNISFVTICPQIGDGSIETAYKQRMLGALSFQTIANNNFITNYLTCSIRAFHQTIFNSIRQQIGPEILGSFIVGEEDLISKDALEKKIKQLEYQDTANNPALARYIDAIKVVHKTAQKVSEAEIIQEKSRSHFLKKLKNRLGKEIFDELEQEDFQRNMLNELVKHFIANKIENNLAEKMSGHTYVPLYTEGRTVPVTSSSNDIIKEHVIKYPYFSNHPDLLKDALSEQFKKIEHIRDSWPSAVCVFGGSRVKSGTKLWNEIEALGAELEARYLPRITGAGPGVMEASLRSNTKKIFGNRQGISIELPFESGVNPYVDLAAHFSYFAPRKRSFYENTRGVIFCPGGIGSMDELWECLNQGVPFFLFKRDYWEPIIDVLCSQLRSRGLDIDKSYFPMFDVKKSRSEIQQAVDFIEKSKFQGTGTNLETLEKMVPELVNGIEELKKLPPSVVLMGGEVDGIMKSLSEKLLDREIPIRASDSTILREVVKIARERLSIDESQALAYTKKIQAVIHISREFERGQEAFLKKYGQSIPSILTRDISIHHVLTTENSLGYVFAPPAGVRAYKIFNKLFDVVVMMQCGIISKRPIVLIDKDFWQPIIEGMAEQMLGHYDFELISPSDKDLFLYADSADKAWELLKNGIQNEAGHIRHFYDKEKQKEKLRKGEFSFVPRRSFIFGQGSTNGGSNGNYINITVDSLLDAEKDGRIIPFDKITREEKKVLIKDNFDLEDALDEIPVSIVVSSKLIKSNTEPFLWRSESGASCFAYFTHGTLYVPEGLFVQEYQSIIVRLIHSLRSAGSDISTVEEELLWNGRNFYSLWNIDQGFLFKEKGLSEKLRAYVKTIVQLIYSNNDIDFYDTTADVVLPILRAGWMKMRVLEAYLNKNYSPIITNMQVPMSEDVVDFVLADPFGEKVGIMVHQAYSHEGTVLSRLAESIGRLGAGNSELALSCVKAALSKIHYRSFNGVDDIRNYLTNAESMLSSDEGDISEVRFKVEKMLRASYKISPKREDELRADIDLAIKMVKSGAINHIVDRSIALQTSKDRYDKTISYIDTQFDLIMSTMSEKEKREMLDESPLGEHLYDAIMRRENFLWELVFQRFQKVLYEKSNDKNVGKGFQIFERVRLEKIGDLGISPLKDADMLHDIGGLFEQRYASYYKIILEGIMYARMCGLLGEVHALEQLKKMGYEILYAGRLMKNVNGVYDGELDVVVRDAQDNIVLVEVKIMRRNLSEKIVYKGKMLYKVNHYIDKAELIKRAIGVYPDYVMFLFDVGRHYKKRVPYLKEKATLITRKGLPVDVYFMDIGRVVFELTGFNPIVFDRKGREQFLYSSNDTIGAHIGIPVVKQDVSEKLQYRKPLSDLSLIDIAGAAKKVERFAVHKYYRTKKKRDDKIIAVTNVQHASEELITLTDEKVQHMYDVFSKYYKKKHNRNYLRAAKKILKQYQRDTKDKNLRIPKVPYLLISDDLLSRRAVDYMRTYAEGNRVEVILLSDLRKGVASIDEDAAIYMIAVTSKDMQSIVKSLNTDQRKKIVSYVLLSEDTHRQAFYLFHFPLVFNMLIASEAKVNLEDNYKGIFAKLDQAFRSDKIRLIIEEVVGAFNLQRKDRVFKLAA